MTVAETLSPALPDGVEREVKRLLESACARELCFATAESCTGGLLASLLTDVEGASHAFERGFVTYSDAAKIELLGVDAALISHRGAVSRAVALAMAEGAIMRSGADIAIAVTGFAGPAGPDDEPGLVHFACARRGGATAHHEAHFGDIGRGPVRIGCIQVALGMMRDALEDKG
jgi:nicotinamide-nucleotide amidase